MFWYNVSHEATFWREQIPSVHEAILKNALDATREDQMEWCRYFLDLWKGGKMVMPPRKSAEQVFEITRGPAPSKRGPKKGVSRGS